MGQRKVWLHLKGRKYQCRDCGRYFRQRFRGILPGRRATEAFRREVVADHEDGICQSRLAKRAGIGSATVQRWYEEFLKRKVSEMKNNPLPRVLGIDEHFFSRRHGYATTLVDLEKHRVYDVVRGRSYWALAKYLGRLPGRERVRVVCMDLSPSYRRTVQRIFPQAKIVSDRFHVIRLVGHHVHRQWRELDPAGSVNRGLRILMRRRPDRLAPPQTERLNRYLMEHPDVQALYLFKEQLCALLRPHGLNQRDCQRRIPELLEAIDQLQASAFEAMHTLGNTLDQWKEEIVRMWRFSRSNGITEGFHTKMEMISRRAYGFRNFQNYRLRVRALCC
jgi:transposase